MKNPVFTGANVAIVTPLTENGLNLDGLGELIDFQIDNGIDSITVCGTTGESATLNHEEHCRVIEYSLKKIAGRVPLIAGTGSNDTTYALELSKFAESVGADGLLMVTPYYNKTTQRGLINHYTYIADRVNIPIIVYNVPSRTGLCCKSDTYFELSKHPNINGVKEASGNLSLVVETLGKCGDELNIWSGEDDQVIPMMSLGAKGVISTAANILPAEMSKMCHLALDGKFADAAKYQIKLHEIICALFKEVNPIPVKTALKLMGRDNGYLRMPLYEIAPENRDLLVRAMKNIGIKIVG